MDLKQLGFPIFFGLLALSVVLIYLRTTKTRPSDLQAIAEYLQSEKLVVVSAHRTNTPWKYWIRGNLQLSNLARTFILIAESKAGTQHEIHVAFDPMRKSGRLQVLR